ncbi:MAG: hypothetical protein RSD10_02975 [Anaerovoracaceae bacterium]
MTTFKYGKFHYYYILLATLLIGGIIFSNSTVAPFFLLLALAVLVFFKKQDSTKTSNLSVILGLVVAALFYIINFRFDLSDILSKIVLSLTVLIVFIIDYKHRTK